MSPYRSLGKESFWSSGVAERHPLSITGLYKKKFDISPTDRIATAGSCFAQHIAGHLRRSGYTVIDAEPPPNRTPEALAKKYGYLIYSARFGNIYLTRQLLQLQDEVRGKTPRKDIVWEKKGRFYDALRPAVEPNGLSTPEEVIDQRRDHLRRVARMFREVDIFIFTFGLTEGWINSETGLVYPTCPGTIAGTFDPKIHAFKNFNVEEVYTDFVAFRKALKRQRPDVRFLVTVSPVPLKATASKHHVLPATTYSKSVLRAVAGQLQEEFDDVDYFPSYEMIASSWSGGFFYEHDLREVNEGGVAAVMRVFSQQHPPAAARAVAGAMNKETVVCEEELLGAFQP
jgi:hypothetical protein